MRKVAIFTEGQTEQIFIRHLVALEMGWDKISFKCLRLYRDRTMPAVFSHDSPHAEIYFQIMDVSGDERVLSVMKERERFLLEKGFEKIVGLRDMYSTNYCKRAGRRIDQDVMQKFIDSGQQIVREMSSPDKIALHFGIMETEAWFLGMCKSFEHVNDMLTVEYIKEKLGFNLHEVDPQVKFIQPSCEVDQIFQLVGRKYGKSRGDVEAICSGIKRRDGGCLYCR
jgi:hypothetical protein